MTPLPRLPRAALRALCTLALAGLLLAGCGPARQAVKVNGYLARQAGVPAQGATLAIRPDPAADNPILEERVAEALALGLNSSGWRVVSGGGPAEYGLAFDYAVEPRLEERSRVVREPGRPVVVRTTDSEGRVVVSEVIPRTETRMVREEVEVYRRWLRVRAAPAEGGQAVWIGKAALTGPNGDLRPALPWLVAALARVFGQDTGRQETVHVPEDDPVAAAIAAAGR
jgi:hypothetical protein